MAIAESLIASSAYDATLLEFPAVLYPIAATVLLVALYGALALWLLRAACWELKSSSKLCAKGERCTQRLDNHTLVLVLACAASFASLCYVLLYFLPTLLHGTLGIDELTVASSVFDRLLGAATDCLFFAASAQLIAFWLELLTSMRSVKRVQRCCWFSLVASAMFSFVRIGAAIVAPVSRYTQLVMLGLALLISWTITLVGAVAALRLCFHMRSMVARNRAARAIRAKMFRIGRFLAVNGALFLLLNVALLITGIGATTLSRRSDPVGVLMWELPTRSLRFFFYLSLAWSCSSSAKRPTARSKLEQRVKTMSRTFANSIRGSMSFRASIASIAGDEEEEDDEDEQMNTKTFVGVGLRNLARMNDRAYGGGEQESDTETEVEMPPKRSTAEMSTLQALHEFKVDAQYYYDADDHGSIVAQGPHSVAELRTLHANGHLHLDNEIREEEDGDLFALRDLLLCDPALEAPASSASRMTSDSGLHPTCTEADAIAFSSSHRPEPTWYYQGVDNKLHGPYTLLQLAEWVREGRVLAEDNVLNGREGDPVALGGALRESGIFSAWWERYGIEVGTVVRHPTRGIGRVTVLDSTVLRTSVHVEFAEDGHTHRYKEASWAKFLPVKRGVAEDKLWGDPPTGECNDQNQRSVAHTRGSGRTTGTAPTRTVSTEWERLQLSITHLEKLAIRTLEGDAEADERDIDGDDAQSSDDAADGVAPLFEQRASATSRSTSITGQRPGGGPAVSSTRRETGRSKTTAPWMSSAREGTAGRRKGRAASDGAPPHSAASPRTTFFDAFARFVGRDSGGGGAADNGSEPFSREDGDEDIDERVSTVSIVTRETITVIIDDGGRCSGGSLLDSITEQDALAPAAAPVAAAAPWWEDELVRVGISVMHPTRGTGIVVRVNVDGDRRVHVDFGGGEVHRYSSESWHKFFSMHDLFTNALGESEEATFASRTAQC